MSKSRSAIPAFNRSEVAKILNVSTLTVANREKSKRYPSPKRDLNNYRVYTINDVLNLQLLTYNMIDPKPIISVLYDKGYKDTKLLAEIIDEAMSNRVGANVAKRK
jgi:transcriptional regulator with XRE-family HTH domain